MQATAFAFLAFAFLTLSGSPPRAQASYTVFGSSCLTVDLTPVAPPRLGQALQLSVPSGWYGANGGSSSSFLLTGASSTNFAGLPLPFDTSRIRSLEYQFCGFLYTSITVVTPLPGWRAYSRATPVALTMLIPNDPALLGTSFYQQVLQWYAGGPLAPVLSLGRGGHGVIGT